MVEFNESNKFKWNILYEVPNNDTKASDIIASGHYYDFIPEKGTIIIIENIIYSVTNKIYDFDKSNIVIALTKLKEGTN